MLGSLAASSQESAWIVHSLCSVAVSRYLAGAAIVESSDMTGLGVERYLLASKGIK